MCNAWNHAPGCKCGWGGEGHLGVISAFHSAEPLSWRSSFSGIPPIHNDDESYINPNAACPVCGSSVFFYQSESGGRVFFDELGPPWPKHPCTDTRSQPLELVGERRSRSNEFQWLKSGWLPFFYEGSETFNPDFIKISGRTSESSYRFYVKKSQLQDAIKESSLYQLRVLQAGDYLLSIWNFNGGDNQLAGFRFLPLESGDKNIEVKEQAKKLRRRKPKVKKQNKPRTLLEKVESSKSRNSREKSSKETSMSIAFEKATVQAKDD